MTVDLILIQDNNELVIGQGLELTILPSQGSDFILHDTTSNSTKLCQVIDVCWYLNIINKGEFNCKVIVRMVQTQDMTPTLDDKS